MNRVLGKVVVSAITVGMLAAPMVVCAENVANGQLIFTGGQTYCLFRHSRCQAPKF